MVCYLSIKCCHPGGPDGPVDPDGRDGPGGPSGPESPDSSDSYMENADSLVSHHFPPQRHQDGDDEEVKNAEQGERAEAA